VLGTGSFCLSILKPVIKIKYVTQIPTPSPSFVFFCNFPELVKEPYKRFLVNKLRENFNFKGAPIQIYVMEK
jgi:GTP-binding protein